MKAAGLLQLSLPLKPQLFPEWCCFRVTIYNPDLQHIDAEWSWLSVLEIQTMYLEVEPPQFSMCAGGIDFRGVRAASSISDHNA